MDYGAIQKLLKESNKSQNVFNTLFHCHKIDSYFERHRILEIIGELMIQVCLDRPDDVIEYLSRKLFEISQKHVKIVVQFEFHESSKGGVMRVLTPQQDIEIIDNVNNEIDLKEHLQNLLSSDILQNHNFVSYMADAELKFFRINQSFPEQTNGECLTKPKDAIDIHLTNKFFNRDNLNSSFQFIRSRKPRALIKGNWNRRVMIVGRMSSGRKTQAALVAKEFGLIFIDLDYLMVQYQQRQSLSKKHNLGFFGYLQETLLKPNCLQNGYVIVGNVISRRNLEILMEKFIYHPNRIIFMHTPERECWRRFSTKGISSAIPTASQDKNIFFNYHMNLYDLNKKAFVEHFTNTIPIFHVNGSKAIQEIKTLIWANLVG